MGGDGYTLRSDDLQRVMRRYLERLGEHRDALNRLNVYPVPDGDTGTNMALTVQSVVAETDRAADLPEFADALSHGSLMGAQGNSGIILSQILRGVAGVLADGEDAVDSRRIAAGLTEATTAAYQAVGKPVEGTILTVLRISAEAAARDGADGPEPLAEFLRRVYGAASAALVATPDQLPVLEAAGVVDAGGAGYLLLLAALLEEVTGTAAALPEGIMSASPRRVTDAGRGAGGGGNDSGPRYEVMFLLEGEDGAGDRLRDAWAPLGESIVVVGGDRTWNCHIHTHEIGPVLEAAVALGGPHRIEVTDLHQQAAAETFHREEFEPTPEAAAARVGVVAVAAGRGIVDLLRDTGVQGVVVGGQTMNPAVRDLLDVVEAVPARTVIVLPNNKNVVPAAEQLDTLTKKRVVVVPTRSVPQGLAAMIEYIPTGTDVEALAAAMGDAARRCVTGEVTRAVRDATTPVGSIRRGDWLGLVDGVVRLIRRPETSLRSLARFGAGLVRGAAFRADTARRRDTEALEAAVVALLEETVRDSPDLVTLIKGADARAEATEAAMQWLAEHHADVPVEELEGGQPLYPYLIGVE